MPEWLQSIDFHALEQAVLGSKESNPQLYDSSYRALAGLLSHPTIREQIIITTGEAAQILGFNSGITVLGMIRDGRLLGFRLHEGPEPILGKPNIGVIRRSVEELIEDPWVQEQRAGHIKLHIKLGDVFRPQDNPQ